MKKRIFSMLLAIIMLACMLPVSAVTVLAAEGQEQTAEAPPLWSIRLEDGTILQTAECYDNFGDPFWVLPRIPYTTETFEIYAPHVELIYSQNQSPLLDLENAEFTADENRDENGWWHIDALICIPASQQEGLEEVHLIFESIGIEPEDGYTEYLYLQAVIDEETWTDFVVPMGGGEDFTAICPWGGSATFSGNLFNQTYPYEPFNGSQYYQNTYKKTYVVNLYSGTYMELAERDIWYTLDGTDPRTSDTARLYTAPIELTKTTLISAAQKIGDEYGQVWRYGYIVGALDGLAIYPEYTEPVESYYAGFISRIHPEEDITYYYTLDGSDPIWDGIEYTEPFLINENVTIKYYGISAWNVRSEVQTHEVTFKHRLFSAELAGEDALRCHWVERKSANDKAAADPSSGYEYKELVAVPYDRSSFEIIARVPVGAAVTLNGEAQTVDAEGSCAMTLTAKNEKVAEGALGNDYVYGENSIVVTSGEQSETWTIYGACALFDDFPDAVTDYLSIGSQYTNIGYGRGGEGTLIGGSFTIGDIPFSVGNFGGYITYYYEDAICDDPANPYGVDFIVYGNSFSAEVWTEPANVLVSEDGETWYNLAGSHHYADDTKWLKGVTCSNRNGFAYYTFPDGTSSMQRFFYPMAQFYPLHFSRAENAGHAQSFTFDAVMLDLTDPDFGYADCNDIGDTNQVRNPYVKGINHIGDAMDLAWAVDAQGQPVTFPNGIHYIKVQNALLIDGAALGEYSAEVNMVRRAVASETAVGRSEAPAAIFVDGQNIVLEEGKFVYDADVHGLFGVKVDATDDTNIYINEHCAASAVYNTMPVHGIIRIIVQQGEKEPLIYYLNLTETGGEEESTAVLTLDANGGNFGRDGAQVITTLELPFDGNMTEFSLPEPKAAPSGKVFAGYYSGMTFYDSYPAVVEDLRLEARWADAQETTGGDDSIRVTFRLIGCTLAEFEDELGTIDLADGNYYGAEYVTWIPTRSYVMEAGSTVRDLMYQALDDAGLRQKGAENSYVSAIWAPESMGGYELAEFTNGARSGWMYTIDGTHPLYSISQMKLSEGDTVIWHYVNDYAWEVEDWAALGGDGWPQLSTPENNYWNKWLEAEDPNMADGYTPPDTNETPDDPGGEVLAPKSELLGTEATASVTEDEISSAVDAAKSGDSSALTIAPEGAEGAKSVAVNIPTSAAKNMAKEKDLGLNVETAVGSVAIPSNALKSVSEQAAGDKIEIVVEEKVAEDVKGKAGAEDIDTEDALIVGVTIKSGDKAISDFGGHAIEILIPVTGDRHKEGETYKVIIVSGSGNIESTVGRCEKRNGKLVVVVRTTHLSTFIVTSQKGVLFRDALNHWAMSAIQYAFDKNIMTGVGAGEFDPEGTFSRAMLATMLYRLEGRPSVSGMNNPFSDVAAGQWYTDAIVWAAKNNIVNGYGGGLFGPSDDISREQMATMLLRYSKYKKYDTSKKGSLAAFSDAKNISTWALDGMKWANAEGLVTGHTASLLAPAGTATRAEAATLLMRFMTNVVR